MKIIKLRFDHLRMFEEGIFEIDFYASDKVPASDESAFELARPIYANNVVALAGINASGKTTALNLVELACRAIAGRPISGGWLPSSFSSVFTGDPLMSCLVWHEGGIYLLRSKLGKRETGKSGKEGLIFAEEEIRVIRRSFLKKSHLASWVDIEALSEPLSGPMERDVPQNLLAANEISLFSPVLAQEHGAYPTLTTVRDEGFRMGVQGGSIDDVLRVFDPSIEHLEVVDSGRVFILSFQNQDSMFLSEDGLGEVLSSGTLRGAALVGRAIEALETGGYLIVDEIENHLNRQLVNVILDLFAARETNPRGATLVFSTHYPQILDHVHRKDNVYFLARSQENKTRVVKYGDRVRRIENKKSEVFLSNFVKGTAPRYTDVRVLKDAIAKAVSYGE